MTEEEYDLYTDLVDRLSQGESIKTIVDDIPYGVLNDEVSNECLDWNEIDPIITFLTQIIKSLLEELNHMNHKDNRELGQNSDPSN